MDETAILQAILSELKEIKQVQSQQGAEISKINLTLENEVAKNIRLLIESQMETKAKMEKLDEMADRIEDIQITVNAMEAVPSRTARTSSGFGRLNKASRTVGNYSVPRRFYFVKIRKDELKNDRLD